MGSGSFLFDRDAAADYEAAKKIAGDMPLIEVAKFWQLHNPETKLKTLAEWKPLFIGDVIARRGKTRHESDLRSRLDHFLAVGFGKHLPNTVTRTEILDYSPSILRS